MESMEVNSVEYWDEKFNKAWDKNNGEKQTEFFCRMFLENIPSWIKKDINDNSRSIIDLGCAEGEAVKILSENFKNSSVTGLDFSIEAIKKAKEKYPNNNFITGNIKKKLMLNQDVIYCSNTLEHFENPHSIIENIISTKAKYIFIMIPFNDNQYSAENGEHEYFFDYTDFKVELGDYNLLFFKVIDTKREEKEYWIGSQAILIYTKDNIKFEEVVLKDLNNYLNYQICQCAKVLCINNVIDKNKLKNNNDLLLSENKNFKSINDLLITENEKLKDENNIIVNEIKELKETYENLYKYSCNRDAELLNIKNSRSFIVYNKFFKKPMKFTYKIMSKLYRILKAILTFNVKNFIKEISYPFIRIKIKISQVFLKKKIFKQIELSSKDKRVIILPPTLDWHMPLFQRPQQLALSYAKKENTLVIYMTKNIQYDHIAVAEKVYESLWIVNENILNQLKLDNSKEKILSLSWTPNKFYCDKVKPDKLIYEYIDELEIFHMYGPDMEKDHQELLKKADVTVCTATKLFNQVKDKAKNPIISTNAGDYEFFIKTNEFEINKLIKEKIKNYDCILGYYGAVAQWFDYELIKKVANKRKKWLWVIIGINYDGTLDKSGILDLENVLYIPPQPYKMLPTFLKAFDVATIPFIINEITLSTSPVKLFEYMASGKPILTSKMPECLKYKSVKTYKDDNEFIDIVEKFIELKKDDIYWEFLNLDAKYNTWDAKTDEILNALYN